MEKRFVALMGAICAFAGWSHPIRSAPESAPAAFHFEASVISVGRGPGSNAIADVNRDGKPDILVVNTIDRTLTVLLGDGQGHFRRAAGDPCPTGPSPNDLAVSDFNGDGHPDVAIANHSTPFITLLLGDGQGGFRPAPNSPFRTPARPHVHGVSAADFNGDGKPDVVTESWEHDQILLLHGDGAGHFILPGRFFPTGKRPYQRLRSADFNHDSFPDIVTTDQGDNAVTVLLGDGKGGLHEARGSPFPAGVFPYAVAIDDLNRDGNPDLIVVPYDRDITDPLQLGVTILWGDGKGGFAQSAGPPLPLAGCRGPERVAAGDLNGDGFRDIAVTCGQNDRLMLYRGSRDGKYTVSARDIQTGWSGLSMGDLNGDGKDDLVVSNGVLEANPNTPAGTVTILFGK